jgi:hypothetical protein
MDEHARAEVWCQAIERHVGTKGMDGAKHLSQTVEGRGNLEAKATRSRTGAKYQSHAVMHIRLRSASIRD